MAKPIELPGIFPRRITLGEAEDAAKAFGYKLALVPIGQQKPAKPLGFGFEENHDEA